MHTALPRVRRSTGRTLGHHLLLLALVATTACSTDKILKVDRPDIIDPNGLSDANGVSALYAGVIGDFSSTNTAAIGVITATGFLTDEFKFGATPPEARQMDQRAAPESNTILATIYRNVQQLRGQADRASVALKAVRATDPRVGEMEAMSGYAHVILAEMFCSGSPLGVPGEDADPQTTTEILTAGLAKLTSAVASSAGDDRARNFASVLRGRTLVDLGQFNEAATAVATVPTSFKYTTLHSTTTPAQTNGFANYMNQNDGILVSNNEGGNGLDFGTAGDPRVPITGDGSPSRFDGQTARYYYANASTNTAPMPIATGVEARLIEAEAALRASNFTGWITKLNEARAFYGMAPLTDPGASPANARVDLMFRERAFSLFASAHRLGDLRRLVRQYGRAAEATYPTGAYHKDGLQLGTDLQFIIPQTEKNNVKFTGCINRDA